VNPADAYADSALLVLTLLLLARVGWTLGQLAYVELRRRRRERQDSVEEFRRYRETLDDVSR
jgi:hypothetical protein